MNILFGLLWLGSILILVVVISRIKNGEAFIAMKKCFHEKYEKECYEISLLLLSLDYKELCDKLNERMNIGIHCKSDEDMIEMLCDELSKRSGLLYIRI
jgi:hypothetical protein